MYIASLLLAVFVLFFVSQCQLTTKKLAIFYDNDQILSSHSIMMGILNQSAENKAELFNLNGQLFSLLSFGNLKYQTIAILSTTNKKWSLNIEEILKFIDNGGNIFLLGNKDSGNEFIKLMIELGFYHEPKRIVADEKSKIDSSSDLIIIPSNCTCLNSPIINKNIKPILFSGCGLVFNNLRFTLDQTNPMTFAILHGSPNAYFPEADKRDSNNLIVTGSNIVLVGGSEFRNLARGVVSVSIESFSNQYIYFNIPPQFNDLSIGSSTGNLNLLIGLIEWVQQHRGVLRISNPKHSDVKLSQTLDEYVVDRLIEYSVTIEVQDNNGLWRPFISNDIQLEIVRLTTFGRVNYTVSSDGRYTARFFSPDFIGIYGLHTHVRKLGYTTIDHQVKIIIRPRRHTDYVRFIAGAYPYYMTAFCMISLSIILVLALINQDEGKEKIL